MYQVAICDDDKEALHFIGDTLVDEFNKASIHIGVDYFDNGVQFLKMFSEHYHFDVIFLDIDMPEIDGIEVARKVRQVAPDCLCVFISNKEEMVFQTFEVQPFRFIRKREFSAFAPTLVNSIKDELSQRNKHFIQFIEKSTGDIFSFEISRIVYVEAQRKKVKVVLDNHEEQYVEMKFMDIENKLESYGFIKPHRSFLVNYHKIVRLSKNTILVSDKSVIPVSRTRAEIVKKQFLEKINEDML